MIAFKDFVRKYNDGSITKDAAWRAYDIEGMARHKHAYAALPLVNFRKGNGDNSYSTVAVWFGITGAERARYLLSLWYVWRAIASGDTRRATLRDAP